MRTKEAEYHTLQQQSQELESEFNEPHQMNMGFLHVQKQRC